MLGPHRRVYFVSLSMFSPPSWFCDTVPPRGLRRFRLRTLILHYMALRSRRSQISFALPTLLLLPSYLPFCSLLDELRTLRSGTFFISRIPSCFPFSPSCLLRLHAPPLMALGFLPVPPSSFSGLLSMRASPLTGTPACFAYAPLP